MAVLRYKDPITQTWLPLGTSGPAGPPGEPTTLYVQPDPPDLSVHPDGYPLWLDTDQDPLAVAGVIIGQIVDQALFVNSSGDAMTGPLALVGEPSDPLQAATKQYVDDVASDLAAHEADGLAHSPLRGNGSPVPVDAGGWNAGASAKFSRQDHKHAAEVGIAVPLGPAAGIGELVTLSRSDHVHPYPTAVQVGAPTTLDQLTDVDISTVPPTVGQALVYDGVTWEPGDIAEGGGAPVTGSLLLDTAAWAPVGGEYGPDVRLTLVNGMVHMEGRIKRVTNLTLASMTWYTIGTVPAEFIPEFTNTAINIFCKQSGVAETFGHLHVGNDGVVKWQCYTGGTFSATYTGWLSMTTPAWRVASVER